MDYVITRFRVSIVSTMMEGQRCRHWYSLYSVFNVIKTIISRHTCNTREVHLSAGQCAHLHTRMHFL